MKGQPFNRELTWIAPLLCLCLIVLGLLRPTQKSPAPAAARLIRSLDGVLVPVEEPYRGTVFTWCSFGVGGYLEQTRAPQTVLMAGGAAEREWFGLRDLMSRIYPNVLKEDRYWDMRNGDIALKDKTGVEVLLSYNAGAYIADCGDAGMIPLLREVGLPSVYLNWHEKDGNESSYAQARVETALVGDPARGEALIARNKQAWSDLKRELKLDTMASYPRVLMMGSSVLDWSYFYLKTMRNSYQQYFPPAGVDNASRDWSGDRQDAERILAMDPEIIYLTGRHDYLFPTENPQEFMQDPRWRDLKAVKEKRVYRMFGEGGLGGIIYQPLYDRFMAEVAHPDLLQPTLRQMIRDRIQSEFNYRLSDDELDEMLNVEENAGSAGAERFIRNYAPQKSQELKR